MNIMKWMEGWGWQEYCEAPADLITTIRTMMREEYDEWKANQR